jgi:hypothetical protein
MNHIWKGKIPPKIKIFMWFLENNVLLTKENLVSRNWTGDISCGFCSKFESTNHLFFTCHTARSVWGGGGGGAPIELTRIMSLQIWSSVGLGLTVISMILKRSEVLGLLPFVGLYGKPEIMCTLKIL